MANQPLPVWPIYRRLLGYTRAYWPFLGAAVAAMLVEAVAGAAFVRLMEPLTNSFVRPTAEMAVQLPLAIVGIFLLRSVATFVTDYGMARTGRNVVRDLREQVLAKYLRLPSSHFDLESTPAMVSRLNFDTEQVTEASSNALKAMITDGLTVVFLLGLMLHTSVRVTLAMLMVTPLIGVIVWYVGKRYRRISGGIQDSMGRMAASAEQSLGAQQDVKVHGAQALESQRYSRLVNRILGLNMKVETTRATASALVQFLAALALAAIVAIAATEALAGRLDAGQFVLLMSSMMAIIPSLRRVTSVQTSISRGVAAAERLFAILDSEEESNRGTIHVARARGELVFDHVSLTYPGHDQPVLSDISFTASPGTVTAIVGRSGSGKTSLVRLVPRFYQPTEGKVTLDGV
ncbi:MAG TPA: ABC transporter transmembrane domain-containing protein, partial [Pseudoxanthomonas sp.]|nr:ABC transporter transmembrane domain-containing protein [Pseudoxanthomonas sp.]